MVAAKKLQLPILIVIFLCLGWGCRCDDPGNPGCGNYDPCWEKESANAIFTLNGKVYARGRRDSLITVETTKILDPSKIILKVGRDHEEYEWIIGSLRDTVYSSEFSLVFDSEQGVDITGPLGIMLIAHRASDQNCFSEYMSVDSFQISTEIIPRQEAAILGTFRGYDSQNPHEIFDVFIGPDPNDNRFFSIQNLPNGCTIPSAYGKFTNEVYSCPGDGIRCGQHDLYAELLTNKDSIQIAYRMFAKDANGNWNTNEVSERLFLGKRKN